MNAPTSHDHLVPVVAQRDIPPAFVEALTSRFACQLLDCPSDPRTTWPR
jgi:hypothetical protein